jgi:hypothetical protein
VDEEVEPAPQPPDLGEHRVHGRGLGDVAMADDGGVELAGERLDPLLQSVALIGQGQRGAVLVGALAMPQAIERLFATPMIRPRLPVRMPGRAASATPGTSLGSPDKTGGVIVSAMNHPEPRSQPRKAGHP